MKNSEESHEGKDSISNLMTNYQNKLVFTIYLLLREHKDHFSMMQNRYRALTSTWLFATFLGMSFFLSGHPKIELPFNVLFGVVLLCFCSGFGITLLWFLDVVLYQKFWIATVVEMARIEEQHSWLAPTNLNILRVRKNKKYQIFSSYFYIWINGVLLLLAGIATGYYFKNNPIMITATALAVVILLGFNSFYMMKKSGELDSVSTQSFL